MVVECPTITRLLKNKNQDFDANPPYDGNIERTAEVNLPTISSITDMMLQVPLGFL